MRYLSLSSFVMVAAGVLLVVASRTIELGPIAFIGGALLFWSGIVKVIAVRIWKTTLALPPVGERGTPGTYAARTVEKLP